MLTVALAGIVPSSPSRARAQQNQKRAGDRVQHTLEVQERFRDLDRGVRRRDRAAGLPPVDRPRRATRPHPRHVAGGQRLERLRSLTGDNPRSSAIGEVQTPRGAKLAELADTVESRAASEAALAREQTDEGMKLMDGIRTAVRAMEREEARLMVERDKAWDAEAARAYRVITLGAVGLFLVTLLAGFASVRDYRVQMEARRTAEALAEELTQQGRELEHLMADAPARDKGEG